MTLSVSQITYINLNRLLRAIQKDAPRDIPLLGSRSLQWGLDNDVKKVNYDFTNTLSNASGRTRILRKTLSLSDALFVIACGDKVIVYISLRKFYHNMKYDKYMYGTVVRLGFPHKVKLYTDSCLRCRSVVLSSDNSTCTMPVLNLQPKQPWMLYPTRYGGIEDGR